MKKKIIIIFIFFSLQSALLIAQCPPGDSLQQKSIQKKISGDKSPEKRLAILLEYKDLINRCGYRKDSVYVWLLWNIGRAYEDRKDFSETAVYYLQAIDLSKSLSQKDLGSQSILDQYYWLSTIYSSLNNEHEKRKAMDSCLAISERLNKPYEASVIWCLLDRQQYFYDIGEYNLCINDAGICEKSALEYSRSVSIPSYINFGKNAARMSFHLHVNALLKLKKFQEVEEMLAQKAEQYKKENSINNLALTYAQLAEVDEKKGDYLQCLANFKLALKTYSLDKDYFNCKQTLNNIGELIYVRHLKDYNQALIYFQEALKYKNDLTYFIRADSVEVLSIYGRIANVYAQKGLFDKAAYYFQAAFNQLKKGATIDDILNSTPDEFVRIKKINYLTELFINLGDAQQKKYEITRDNKDLRSAIDIYDKADKFFARINMSQVEQDSKLLWRAESRRLYEHAIEACYRIKDPGKAFYFFERSRAVLLNIQLTERKLLGSGDISRLDGIKMKITSLSSVINNLPDGSTKKNLLQDSLRAENDRMYSLVQLVKTSNPLYYQNMDTAMVSMRDARDRLLKDHQAIMEMFSGDSAVYSLLITSKDAIIYKIDKKDFDKTVNSYTSFLSNYELLNKDFAGFQKIAYHLYKLILQDNIIPGGRIIVSPEGYYFPFESLITNNSLDNPSYFISGHAVSYSYSIRYLLNNFNSSKSNAAGNFLGIAPVNYSGFNLVELSGSDISLKNIRTSVGASEIFIYQNATKNNFTNQFRHYEILQLYTHASDSSDRKEPVIYFSDSALYMAELNSASQPATELIVLSACETGNGKLYQGEGVFSFNRAFASLGIPSSITNLWSINNKSTYAITEMFYKNLAEGMPMDIALQKAKLQYMNSDEGENQLPYFWAAPVLVGKSGIISLEKPFLWKWFLLAAGLFIIGFVSWRIIKPHKRKSIPIPGKAGTAS